MNKVILLVLLLFCGSVSGCLSVDLQPVVEKTITAPPETVTTTTTEVIYTGVLKRFSSYEELAYWLASIENEMRAARQPDWTCSNYAWWLVERAQADGYLMVFHPVLAEVYNSSFTDLQLDEAHAITATYISGHTYLIEPQNLEVFPNYNVE